MKTRKLIIALGVITGISLIITWLIVGPTFISRTPFDAPDYSFDNWADILANPQPITMESFSTGDMKNSLSGIMNLDHPSAASIADEEITIPVIANIIQHETFGTTLIDTGLDSSYESNPYGTIKGLMTNGFLGEGSQDPGTDMASVLDEKELEINGVWLTHLHFDHTAGILGLPKDIPYVVGEDEIYTNFRFIIKGDQLAGIEQLYEIDFSAGIDLPPFGKAVDLYGDNSLWAIQSGGHSNGHVLFFVNGVEEQVIFTGDACNTALQFDTGIGPGSYSGDIKKAQESLDQLIRFKEIHPEVKLIFGHDLETR